jgi:transposase-like protein
MLYGIVEQYRAEYFEAVESKTGRSPRKFIKREFDSYLKCGIYEHGMMRTKCSDNACGHENVVALSCKGRGFCPSCGGRRMVETATNLTNDVLPDVRYRQFVLTLPISLRFMCALNRKLLQKIHSIVADEYKNFYRDGRLPEDGSVGGVTFIQRFNSGCDFNLHFHTIMADGVWLENAAGELKFFKKSLSERELGEILVKISTRTIRHLRRQGLLDENGEAVKAPVLDDDLDHLEVLTKSLYGKKLFSDGIQSLTKIGKGFGYSEELPERQKRMTVTLNGFSLHGGTVVNANSRDKLFKLLEYQCRPPISDSRLEVMDDDSIRLKLKRVYSDGTVQAVCTNLLGSLLQIYN